MASVPPVVKSTCPSPSGAISTIARAASPRTSDAWPGASVQSVGLLLDSRDDARMLVAEVCEDQLRAEVQVAAAVGIDDVATGAANEGLHIARPLHRPRMKDQLVEIHGVLGHGCRPQHWMSVNVVPHLPGSANSPSASRRSEASWSSLSVSSSRASSATLN
jgi:hypothetical protein